MTSQVHLEPGSLFAKDFRVIRRLGEGGMGALYVVEQVSTRVERALKLMQPQLVADPKLRQRFEQEATVGGRIESDHVVKVLAAGVDEATDTPWLVMELLQGEDLASHVERTGPMPRSEVLRVFEQLCHAVGAAHGASIVHRDLKPENVFLARSRIVGVPWLVKVLDFGIAKVASDAKTSDTATIGSPIWMAPEQGTRGGLITPHTDVWALGLIAFYLLTGCRFWNCARDDTTNLMMLLREIMIDPIPAASARAQELGRAQLLPPGFDAWMARCVSRDPAFRFAHAGEVYAALAALLALAGENVGSTAPMFGTAPIESGASSQVAAGHPVTQLVSARSGNLAEGTAAARTRSVRPRVLALSSAVALIAVAALVAVRFAHRRSAEAAAAGTAAAAPAPGPSAGLTALVSDEPNNGAASVAPSASEAVSDAPKGSDPGPHTVAHAPGVSHGPGAHVEPAHAHSVEPTPPEVGPVAPQATSPTEGSEVGGFDRPAANAALAAAASDLQSCRKPDGPAGEARVVITFSTTGKAVDVHLEGPPLAGTPTGRCIASHFRRIKVPPFSGDPVVLRRRYTIE